MQDDQLFAGSIEQNVTLFDDTIDRDRLKWALDTAAIAEDVHRMPMGLNTLVGDMGAALSGGQVQRLLLARALYRQPKILIMDEGTSHLDIDMERRVNEALRDLKITRIIAAHRPDTIAAADRVYHLENGSVREVNYRLPRVAAERS
jgi:ATP-binding cassette subfamily B protein RaxB